MNNDIFYMNDDIFFNEFIVETCKVSLTVIDTNIKYDDFEFVIFYERNYIDINFLENFNN